MNNRVDLHTHTHFSDGILSPAELLAKAESIGLVAISITDHDTIDGYLDGLNYKSDYNVELICGCEFSCYDGGKEYHILGYAMDPTYKLMLEHLNNFRNVRYDRAKHINRKLDNLGYKLNFDKILAKAGKASIARPHIASALVDEGYVNTEKQAFELLIGDGCPAYHPKAVFPVEKAISLINRAGGVAILAHPRNMVDQPTLYKKIQSGLDGIEVYHPSHNQNHRKFYHSIASQYWLLETGGSDFHGNREYDHINFGKETVPFSIVESIKYHIGLR